MLAYSLQLYRVAYLCVRLTLIHKRTTHQHVRILRRNSSTPSNVLCGRHWYDGCEDCGSKRQREMLALIRAGSVEGTFALTRGCEPPGVFLLRAIAYAPSPMMHILYIIALQQYHPTAANSSPCFRHIV